MGSGDGLIQRIGKAYTRRCGVFFWMPKQTFNQRIQKTGGKILSRMDEIAAREVDWLAALRGEGNWQEKRDYALQLVAELFTSQTIAAYAAFENPTGLEMKTVTLALPFSSDRVSFLEQGDPSDPKNDSKFVVIMKEEGRHDDPSINVFERKLIRNLARRQLTGPRWEAVKQGRVLTDVVTRNEASETELIRFEEEKNKVLQVKGTIKDTEYEDGVQRWRSSIVIGDKRGRYLTMGSVMDWEYEPLEPKTAQILRQAMDRLDPFFLISSVLEGQGRGEALNEFLALAGAVAHEGKNVLGGIATGLTNMGSSKKSASKRLAKAKRYIVELKTDDLAELTPDDLTRRMGELEDTHSDLKSELRGIGEQLDDIGQTAESLLPSAMRLLKTYNNLMTISTDRAPNYQPIDLAALLREKVGSYSESIDQDLLSNIQVTVTVDPCLVGTLCLADPAKLHLIWENLFGNSVSAHRQKYCDRKDRVRDREYNARIDIRLGLDGDDLVYDHSDNGIGNDELETKFDRLESTSEGTKGYRGMGLKVVAKMINDLGGTVGIQSTTEKPSIESGTNFRIKWKYQRVTS